MERYVLLVFTLLCIYVTFSYAEETKEKTISVSHLESQPNGICPDGTECLNRTCCPTRPDRKLWDCCDPTYGPNAVCCDDFNLCCPKGWKCITPLQLCISPGPMYSSVLRVQRAIPLVNSTEKRFRDDGVGMDPKVNRIIPSQQAETTFKRSGLIDTFSDVFSSDEKYQCPDGTTICELSSGIYGCCPFDTRRRP